MTDDVRKLLGGYATGTLTEEEKQTLFNAALDDADLFNALADEHALKELLDDPTTRAQALRAAETPVFSITAVLREWFERPRSKALVATGAVLVIAIAITTYRDQQHVHIAGVQQTSEPALLAPMVPTPAPARESAAPQRQESKPPNAAEARPAPPVIAEKREAQPSADTVASGAPEVKLTAEREQRVDQVRVTPSAPAPAPAAVAMSFRDEQLAKIASPVKYTLMRKSAAGEFQPVALDSELAADEEARLRVEVTEAGTVGLARDDVKSVTSTFVQPQQPATFSLPAGTRSAKLSFTPASVRLVGSTLIPQQRSQMRAKQAPAAAVEADMQKQAEAPAPVQIEIKLNRK
jgi:hypothetical protein